MTLIRNTKDLGAAISARRKQKGLTQTDLAELTGTSLRLVSELERGVRAANVAKVLLICARLGLDLEVTPREERR